MNVIAKEIETIFNKKNNFNRESDMCEFIENNIELFCEDVLNSKYISHEYQSYMNTIKKLGPNKPHVDFLIKCEDGYHLVECKNPKNIYRENNQAIAQILDYINIAEKNGFNIKGSWIVTSKYKEGLEDIINRFNLPINICVLNKDDIAIWKRGESYDQRQN